MSMRWGAQGSGAYLRHEKMQMGEFLPKNDSLSNLPFKKEDLEMNTIDIKKIKKTILYGQTHIKAKGSPQHSVIFWGNTGVGKSATITILNGQQMYGFKQNNCAVISNFKNSEDRNAAKQKIKQKQQKQEGGVFIEDKAVSGTVYPAHLQMKGQHVTESVDLWDTPGFGDTKGITQILINTYFIHRLFNILPSVKLFFTINFMDLDLSHRGKEFKKIAKSLAHALAKFTDYQNSMGLLVTKVPPKLEESEVLQLLFENMKHLEYLQKEKDINNFFKNIKQRKMKIVLVQSPDVTSKDTPSNPKNVTQQYKHFVNNFYNVVTQNLKAAKVPALEAPGMSKSEIRKCEQFLQTTILSLSNETNNLMTKLQVYIRNRLSIKIFSIKKQTNRQILLSIQNTRLFIESIKQISTRQPKSIEELNRNYDTLTNIFESNANMFECKLIQGKVVCQPMMKIKNLNIVVDFLSGINFSSNVKFSRKDSLIKFFNVLTTSIIQIEAHANAEIMKILAQYHKHVVGNLTRHYESWRREQLFQQWIKNLRVVPGLYLRARKFFKNNSNFMDYLNELQTMEREVQMKCPEDIASIIQIYQYSKDVANLNVNQPNLIMRTKNLCNKNQQKIKQFLNQIWFNCAPIPIEQPPPIVSANVAPPPKTIEVPQPIDDPPMQKICPCSLI